MFDASIASPCTAGPGCRGLVGAAGASAAQSPSHGQSMDRSKGARHDCVAALGLGDIPVPAFARSFNLAGDGG